MSTPRPKRSWLRRAVRIFLWTLGTVVVLAVLAVGLLHTRWGKEFVRGRIEARLAKTFVGGATLGELDYGFLFSSVELGDLTLNDAAGHPAIKIHALHADLDRRSLLAGTPVIDDLAITGLDVHSVEDAQGRSSLVGLTVPSDRAPPSSITVRAISLAGNVTVTKADGTVITIRDLAVAGSVTARPRDKDVELALGPLGAQLAIAHPGAPPRELALAIGSTSVTRHGTATQLDLANLAAGALSIEGVHARVGLEAGVLVGAQDITFRKLRVDHEKLRTQLGRAILIDDVRGDVTLKGPADALIAHGAVATRSTSLTLDGTIDLSNRARPRFDLVLVGRGDSADLMLPTARHVPSITTDIRIGAKGAGLALVDLEAALTVEVGATKIGAIAVEGLTASLTANRGAFTLDQFSARGLGFELGATGQIDRDATLHGRLTATGDPARTVAVLREAGIAVPPRVPRLPHLALAVTAAGKLDGDLALELEPLELKIAGGAIAASGAAHLAHRALVEASTTITLRALDLAALARLAGRRLAARGQLSGKIELHRTLASQRTTYDLAVALQGLTLHAQGQADPAQASATGRIVAGGVHVGDVVATLPLDRGHLAPGRPFHLALDMPSRALTELAALAPPAMRSRLPAELDGALAVHADLRGTPRAPRGTVDVTLTGARHAELHATIASSAKGIVVTTAGAGASGPLAAVLDGSITIPSLFRGRAFQPDRRIQVDETVTLADRPLAELPSVPPKLAALGGVVSARVHVTGMSRAPVLDGTVAWRGYQTASGDPGETTLALAGTPTRLTATLSHGHGAATIVAEIERGADRIDVHARAHADDTALLPLVPALATVPEAARATASSGKLRWDMRADLGLARSGNAYKLDRAIVDGSLALRAGEFQIPNSTRRWHDLALEITGDPHGLRLAALDVHESDAKVADRRLHASGLLTIEGTKPTKLALALTSKDWLLLGLTSPLFTDAPTAELDLGARVEADLTTPIPAIDVTIDSLALRAPDRHLRAHQPERTSATGDVIFVGPNSPVGKLPVLAPVAPLPGGRPLDVRVHLPTPAHVLRDPLDVVAQGELAITVRPEVTIARGEIALLSGSLNLFAFPHRLVHGRILVTEEHPRGWLELEFERRLPEAAARALADPALGARLTLSGEPTKPVLTPSGAAAALPEVFSLYDAGHAMFDPHLGVPASSSVHVPRGDQINILAFVSLSLPHLMFLDRVTAWADAAEPRGAYGRIRNLEADRYTTGNRNRIRTLARPTTPGRSTAELQLDHLLLHDARKLLGIGVRAGDRLGGGVGLIFEWSSSP